jgi:hypothetical protein
MLQTCHSPQEASQRYIEFALSHPNEYQLSFAYEFEPLDVGRPHRSRVVRPPEPIVESMRTKLAEWFGGSPEDYQHLALAFLALNHGTSMLLISKTVRDDLSKLLWSCNVAVTVLVKNHSAFMEAK